MHRLADGGAGGDDIVHDQHAALERRTDEGSALAVILDFLAVEAPGRIAAMLFGQGDGDRCHQRDALVGGAEQQVEFQSGVGDRGGVAASQAGQRRAAVEQAGVEEVGADPPGFQGELAEAQHAPMDGEIEKIPLIVAHGWRFRLKRRKCRYHSALHRPSTGAS